MKKIFLFAVLLVSINVVFAQKNIDKAQREIDALFSTTEIKPKIHLLGVFHFAGEKIDSNTVPPKWSYVATEPKRQREIEEVRSKLVVIKPTVVCVEFPPAWQEKLDSVYSLYCSGQVASIPGCESDGEIVQLAFAVGKRLGLKKIHAVDAQAVAVLNNEKLYELYQQYAPQEDTLFKRWNATYYRKTALEDSLRYSWTTLNFLRLINDESYNQKMLGRWLITTRHGSNTKPAGADLFITRYYNRNIRIYSNIQRAIQRDTDKVLVIYGNTHMSVLRNLFTASPLYEVVPAEQFLR